MIIKYIDRRGHLPETRFVLKVFPTSFKQPPSTADTTAAEQHTKDCFKAWKVFVPVSYPKYFIITFIIMINIIITIIILILLLLLQFVLSKTSFAVHQIDKRQHISYSTVK